MFTLSRRIVESHRYVAEGKWEDPVSPYLDLQGVELGGKTLGLVGLGAIGSEVAKLASAMGMNVVASDPYVSTERASQVGARLTDLDSLLAASDFVSLHLPASPDTPTLIDSHALETMQTQRLPHQHLHAPGRRRLCPAGGIGEWAASPGPRWTCTKARPCPGTTRCCATPGSF